MVLKIFGALFLSLGAFVGFLHGILYAQGKRSPETLGRYHDWPVVGGFFPRYDAEPAPPTDEELRTERAALRIARTKSDFRLPPPFEADELQKLVQELSTAKSEQDATHRAQDEERERLKRAEADLAERQAEFAKVADRLENREQELKARSDELERERLFVMQDELKNLKSLSEVYAAMAPEDAARRFAELDTDTTAKLVSVMSDRKAGKILGAMDVPKAVEITKRVQAFAKADAKK
jgi:flagellar motility protein MotE (MotC chaperone)